ncbi:MAG: toxin-activating lysine-acyltransferase [Caulobacterales bacterium]
MTDPQSVPFQPKTVAQILGEVTWLLTQSPIHKQLFIGDLEWFAMPAILLEQFRVFYGPIPPNAPPGATPTPAAIALWAFVSPETDARLEGEAFKIAPHEWNAGDQAWLIELVAPFGAQEEIIRDLATNVFSDRPFKFHMTGPDGQRRVMRSDAVMAAERPN